MEHYSAGDKTTMIQPESQWDKLLKIKTTGRDDSRSDRYRYPMSRHPILSWKGWRTAAISGRGIRCLTMEPEKAAYASTCPTRPDADPLGSNVMSAFMPARPQTGCRLSQVDGPASPWKVRNSTGFRQRRTDAISSTRFPWKS